LFQKERRKKTRPTAGGARAADPTESVALPPSDEAAKAQSDPERR